MESIHSLYDDKLKQFISKMKKSEFNLSEVMNSNTLRMALSETQVGLKQDYSKEKEFD
jgi:hypothetical protein